MFSLENLWANALKLVVKTWLDSSVFTKERAQFIAVNQLFATSLTVKSTQSNTKCHILLAASVIVKPTTTTVEFVKNVSLQTKNSKKKSCVFSLYVCLSFSLRIV